MGYTHYWERPETLPHPQFAKSVEDCRRLCDALNIPLGDDNGENQPTFTAEEICFNGHRDSGRLSSFQKAEGLVWPQKDAHGVAAIGEAEAVVGGWYAGPAVSARVPGPDGNGSYEPFHVERVHFFPLRPDRRGFAMRCTVAPTSIFGTRNPIAGTRPTVDQNPLSHQSSMKRFFPVLTLNSQFFPPSCNRS